jgi:putative transposase
VRLNTWRYTLTRDPQEALRQRLRELAAVRVRFGYRRLTVLLKREGWTVNAKRVYRLYDLEGLALRTKPRKKLASRARVPAVAPTRPNERWTMDFVSARTADGRWFRTLTIVDIYTREALALGRRSIVDRREGRGRAQPHPRAAREAERNQCG